MYLLLFVLTSIDFLWIRIPAEAGSKYFSQSFCSFSNPSLIFLNLFYIREKDLYFFRFYLYYNSPAQSLIILLTLSHTCVEAYTYIFSQLFYTCRNNHIAVYSSCTCSDAYLSLNRNKGNLAGIKARPNLAS